MSPIAPLLLRNNELVTGLELQWSIWIAGLYNADSDDVAELQTVVLIRLSSGAERIVRIRDTYKALK